MPNKNYIKGRNKEYKICKEYKDKGCDLTQRSAGSHSEVDVFAINSKTKEIFLIQAKPDYMTDKEKEKIKEKNINLNGTFKVKFLVI